MRFIYIYSENFKFYSFGKILKPKGSEIYNIFGNSFLYGENLVYSKRFEELKLKTENKLRDALDKIDKKKSKNYPKNLKAFESTMFITKKIFQKERILFQGGEENIIIGLSNLLDLINYSIENDFSFIRILLFNNHKEYQDWVAKVMGDDSSGNGTD